MSRFVPSQQHHEAEPMHKSTIGQRVIRLYLIVAMIFGISTIEKVSAQTRVYSLPSIGLFYFATSRGTNGPPAPSCPFSPDDVPVYLVSTSPDRYLIDDSNVEPMLSTTSSEESESESAPPAYGSNDFWIELSVTNGLATPIVHGTVSNYYYQVETNLDLAIWHHWTPGEICRTQTERTQCISAHCRPRTSRRSSFAR
jgi:hypothetical protein